MKKITKSRIKEYFKNQLGSNKDWAIRGMLKIYEFQTHSEKVCQTTREHNDVGFSGCDAEILSSFCEQFKKWNRLSDKQMAIVFKKMPKYWKQLVSISNMEIVENNIRQTEQIAA